jgi:hypothetical protein
MSTPTGSEQNYPQGGAPQGGQPGWSTPPQPPAGYNPPGYDPAPSYAGGSPAAGERPSQVTAAAVIGIVIGALGSLGGLIGLFGLGLVFAFDAVLGLLTLLSFAVAVVLLVGGIQAIQGKSPRLLLLGSFASIGVQLLYLIWSIVSGWGFAFFGLLGFILPIVIVYLLRQPIAKQYYASRGISY